MVGSESIYQLVDELVNESSVFSHAEVFYERLRGYYSWSELPALEDKVVEWSKEHPVIWNIGIGPSASFVPTLSRLLFERINDIYGPYDHIARVRRSRIMAAGRNMAQRQLAIEAHMEMVRILEIPLPNKELKQRATEENYFGYGALSDYLMLQAFGTEYAHRFGSDPLVWWDPSFYHQPYRSPLHENVRDALQKKRHLLLVENLHVPVSLGVFVFATGNRPSPFLNWWLISATSKDVCDRSKLTEGSDYIYYNLSEKYYDAPPFGDVNQREWAMLIKEALRDAAGSIHNTLQQQGRNFKFWLQVAQHCFYYCILHHPLQEDSASSVSSDELVRCWVAEDLLFSTTSPTDIPASHNKKQSTYYRSAYEAGKVVIQALQEYSLLPIYSVSSTPTTSSTSGMAITGVSKVAEGVPKLQQDELVDHDKSSRLRWVSFMNDAGRHVSWDCRHYWMNAKFIPGEITMSTLILRGSSNIPGFPFNEVLNNHLRVLDLSYTPIYFLPSGFSELLNLHLLSLRGCSQLKTLSPPPSTPEEETAPLAHLGNLQVLDMNGVPLLQITQDDGSNKSNLHFLDLSGSRVTTLPLEFFHSMSSLEELILCNCCNLEEREICYYNHPNKWLR